MYGYIKVKLRMYKKTALYNIELFYVLIILYYSLTGTGMPRLLASSLPTAIAFSPAFV